ncbi:MAG: hypothetical protein R3F11_24085 [Verrucomicrobiales bacterium]
MEIAGFSCLTNWGAGLSRDPLSHAEAEVGGRAAGQLVALLEAVLAA